MFIVCCARGGAGFYSERGGAGAATVERGD